MGRLFNRIKRVARMQLNSLKDKVLDSNLFSDKKEDSDDSGINFEEEWSKIKRKYSGSTQDVPYTLNDSYELLGVTFGTNLDGVKKAWRALLRINHPDKFPEGKDRERATKKAAKINEAYQKIEDFFTKGKT